MLKYQTLQLLIIPCSRNILEKNIIYLFQERHGEQSESVIKFLTGIFDIYEPPGENEKNTYNVEITEDMTQNDVLKKVQNILVEIGTNC